jgi:hypothetical protein
MIGASNQFKLRPCKTAAKLSSSCGCISSYRFSDEAALNTVATSISFNLLEFKQSRRCERTLVKIRKLLSRTLAAIMIRLKTMGVRNFSRLSNNSLLLSSIPS